jgi:hypothetical protein
LAGKANKDKAISFVIGSAMLNAYFEHSVCGKIPKCLEHLSCFWIVEASVLACLDSTPVNFFRKLASGFLLGEKHILF